MKNRKIFKWILYTAIILRLDAGAQEEFVQDMHTIGLWHFNENSGDTAFDFSGSNLHGLLENGSFWTDNGRFGNCLVFTGADQRVRVYDHPALDFKDVFTIDAWVMLFPSNDRSVIVSKWNSTHEIPPGQYLTGFDSGHHLYFSVADSSRVFTVVADSAAPFNEWILVSAVFDHGKTGLFLNGEQVASGKAPFSSVHNGEYKTDDLFIGDLWTDEVEPYSMDGRIDEVRISDTARQVVTRVDNQEIPGIPDTMHLSGNFPNPCNPGTTIRFELFRPDEVTLSVCTLSGRQIRLLLSEFLPGGQHRIGWDGMDDSGRPLPSGVYFCRMASAAAVKTHKMILIR